MVEAHDFGLLRGGIMTAHDLLSTYIAERDLDFLFLEEFNCNAPFQKWFWRKTHPDLDSSFPLDSFILNVKAIRSISESGEAYGETDILVDYFVKEPAVRPVRFLVENKIIAPFGDRQIERYRDRSQKYVDKGKCEKCFTVLLAPACYYQNAPFFKKEQKEVFDFIIAYDEILGFLAGLASNEYDLELTNRYIHKTRLLTQAIEKSRRGYVPVNDPVTQEFNVKYYQYVIDQPFGIRVRNPSHQSVPAGDSWFYLHHPNLKKDRDLLKLKLVHKILPKPDRLDLQFTGWGKYDAIVRPKLEPLLEYRMRYVLTKNKHTVMISIPLIPIDMKKSFEEESPKIHAALGEAKRIITWLDRNHPHLLAIAKEIKNQEKE